MFQKKTLGISAEYLKRKAEFFGLDYQDILQKTMDQCSGNNAALKEMIKKLLGPTDKTDLPALNRISSVLLHGGKSALLLGIAQLPEEAAKAIPIVGSIIGAVWSGTATFGLLRTLLWFHTLAAETFYDVEREIEKEYLNRQA